jgi:hypothetical protein
VSRRARARFATEKSDILTDAHAYDECMRIRQEQSPNAMRTFCSEVRFHRFVARPSNLKLIKQTIHPELHLRHDDPRHQRPAQRPPLRARIRRARPSRDAACLSARAERARGRAGTAQSSPARRAVSAHCAHRAPA